MRGPVTDADVRLDLYDAALSPLRGGRVGLTDQAGAEQGAPGLERVPREEVPLERPLRWRVRHR
jgi:hypothetical protein